MTQLRHVASAGRPRPGARQRPDGREPRGWTNEPPASSVVAPMRFFPQVEPDHYFHDYDDKARFVSYWTQAHEVMRLGPESVLEVGIGNGFLHRYLRQRGLTVHTADADARLGPDTVAALPSLPFGDRAFQLVCCFETLEHLPFAELRGALEELRRVADQWVLISVPDVTPYARFHLEWGFGVKLLSRFFDLPALYRRRHQFDGQHHWEIGKRGYPIRRVVREIESAGLAVEAAPRVPENPLHRFFRCRVRP